MGSSFIHLIRTDSNVLFLMAEQYSIVYMYHGFLIHSSADGHLGCFHALAIINSAFLFKIALIKCPQMPMSIPSILFYSYNCVSLEDKTHLSLV